MINYSEKRARSAATFAQINNLITNTSSAIKYVTSIVLFNSIVYSGVFVLVYGIRFNILNYIIPSISIIQMAFIFSAFSIFSYTVELISYFSLMPIFYYTIMFCTMIPSARSLTIKRALARNNDKAFINFYLIFTAGLLLLAYFVYPNAHDEQKAIMLWGLLLGLLANIIYFTVQTRHFESYYLYLGLLLIPALGMIIYIPSISALTSITIAMVSYSSNNDDIILTNREGLESIKVLYPNDIDTAQLCHYRSDDGFDYALGDIKVSWNDGGENIFLYREKKSTIISIKLASKNFRLIKNGKFLLNDIKYGDDPLTPC